MTDVSSYSPAFDRGRIAFIEKKSISHNPYPEGYENHAQWKRGFAFQEAIAIGANPSILAGDTPPLPGSSAPLDSVPTPPLTPAERKKLEDAPGVVSS